MNPRAALVALALLAPAGLVAQSPELVSRVDSETLAVVAPLLEAAVRDSLPLRALESKVLEGVVKNVPAERIGAVVSGLADEFRAARSALRDHLPDAPLRDGEVVAVATAARQGVGFEVSRSLWASRADGVSLEVPVTVLGELVRRGVPVAQAAEVMTHVVGTSVPLPVAAQIPGKIDGAVGAGASPGSALASALRALNIPNPPNRPRGKGRRPGG
ncbi:MAG: hypothetical protein OEN56_15910 [Gemmatimonadota bacterium]|nr:hypothetical protein [Gemmatimonadota bacterium]